MVQRIWPCKRFSSNRNGWRDNAKTAFFYDGRFEYSGSPFESRSAPATLRRTINRTLRRLICKVCFFQKSYWNGIEKWNWRCRRMWISETRAQILGVNYYCGRGKTKSREDSGSKDIPNSEKLRRFINDFTKIAKPLNNLPRKGGSFVTIKSSEKCNWSCNGAKKKNRLGTGEIFKLRRQNAECEL